MQFCHPRPCHWNRIVTTVTAVLSIHSLFTFNSTKLQVSKILTFALPEWRRADRAFEDVGPVLCEALTGIHLPAFPDHQIAVQRRAVPSRSRQRLQSPPNVLCCLPAGRPAFLAANAPDTFPFPSSFPEPLAILPRKEIAREREVHGTPPPLPAFPPSLFNSR